MEFLVYPVLGFVWWIVLFPVVWIVCTPFILVAALFRRSGYFRAVADMYGGITSFWREWGLFLSP